MHQDVKAEVIERTTPNGQTYLVERLERSIPPRDIPANRVNIGCEACDNYGKNLACPPHSPYVQDYLGGPGRGASALVICYRVPLEQFRGVIMEERYEAAYAMVKDMLEEELLRWRGDKGVKIAGSGPCEVCPECSVSDGDTADDVTCRFPEKRIYSLEAMGVSVVSLSEVAFGITLDWSAEQSAADTVSALGAVFIEDSD